MDEEFVKERIKRKLLEENITDYMLLKDTMLDCNNDVDRAKKLIKVVINSLRMDE